MSCTAYEINMWNHSIPCHNLTLLTNCWRVDMEQFQREFQAEMLSLYHCNEKCSHKLQLNSTYQKKQNFPKPMLSKLLRRLDELKKVFMSQWGKNIPI